MDMTILNLPLDPNRPVLSEWEKWAWASVVEREYWNEAFNRASIATSLIERLAVADGVRTGARIIFSDKKFLEEIDDAAKYGLLVIPYRNISSLRGKVLVQQGFGSQMALVVKPENADAAFSVIKALSSVSKGQADPSFTDDLVGEFLGYPKCCRDFYSKTWGAGQVDCTWEQYASTGNANGPIECNMLWRWKGIRWVPHMPCSFQCAPTVEFGKKMREVAIKYGYVEEARTIDQVLSWTTRVSAVNGILEIESPAIKTCYRTDWAPPSHQRHFVRLGRPYVKPTEAGWKLNGMRSYGDMLRCHDDVIVTCKEFVPANANVIDLGCGNGALLRRLKLHLPNISIGGIDREEEAISYAKTAGPGKWITGDFSDTALWLQLLLPDVPNVLIYSPNRLLEVPETLRVTLLEAISKVPMQIPIVYEDNLRTNSLDVWCQTVGLPTELLLVTSFQNPIVSVGVIRYKP